MKVIRSVLLLLLPVILNIPAGVAQQTWSLDRCIRYAWDNSYPVHNQELGVRIQKTDFRQAYNDLLPDIGFQTTCNQNFGRSIDPTTNGYIDVRFYNNSYALSATLDLFAGFMKLNTISMQRLNYEAEKDRLQQVRNEVAFTVINAYYNVLLQMGLTAIAAGNFDLSRSQFNYTREYVALGRKPGTDLLDTEANMSSDSSVLIQSRNLLDQAILTLKYQMNFPPDDSLQIDTLVPSILSGTLDTLPVRELFTLASSNLPDLRYAKNNLLAAKKAVQVSKGAFSPRLEMYAGWGSIFMETNRDSLNRVIPFSDQMTNNANEYISLGLSIPIFSKFSRYSSLSKSKLRYQQARVQYEDISYKLRMTVERSVTEWRAARAEYQSSLTQLAKNLKSYQAAEKKLEKGLINIIEFDIQKNKWARARTEVLRTGLQVLLKEKYLRFLITGSLLSA